MFKVGGKMFARALAREPLEVSVKCEPDLAWACATPTPRSAPATTSTSATGTRSLSTAASTTPCPDMVEDSYDLAVARAAEVQAA